MFLDDNFTDVSVVPVNIASSVPQVRVSLPPSLSAMTCEALMLVFGNRVACENHLLLVD